MNTSSTSLPAPAKAGSLQALTQPRTVFVLVIVLVVASMAAALYLQHVEGLAPCPLCVLQRVAFIAAGVFAMLGLLLGSGRGARLVTLALAWLSTAAGIGVAGWHSWIVAYPPVSLSCGRPFEWFHEDFPLSVWLPKIFRGDGDCFAVDWSLLGLNIPNWSLLVLVVMLVLLTTAFWRSLRSR